MLRGADTCPYTNTPCGRSHVGEVVAACRRAGLRVGIYFPVWDLDHPGLDGGLGTAIGPDGKPITGSADSAWRPSPAGIQLMRAQVEELMSDDGAIDVLWFDVRRAPPARPMTPMCICGASELCSRIL